MGAKPEIGIVAYSRTFPTERAAEREANAWRSTGDWDAKVIQGKAPRSGRRVRKSHY
jgi:hypothetical protein